jgi:hypothetical protein
LGLIITIFNQSPTEQTVALTVAVEGGDHVQFITPPTIPELSLLPGQQLTRTMQLAVEQPPPILRSQQTIRLDVARSSRSIRNDLVAEGRVGRYLREFVDSTVNKTSPIALLIAFLVPVFIQGAQFYVKDWRIKREAHKKNENDLLIEKWENSIYAHNLERAEQVLSEIESSWAADLYPEQLALRRQLIALARLECKENKVDEIIRRAAIWPNVRAVVFTLALRKAMLLRKRQGNGEADTKEYVVALEKAGHQLSQLEIADEWQTQLALVEYMAITRLKEEGGSQPLIKTWPRPPQKPLQPPKLTSSLAQDVLEGRDPFAKKKAEQELYYLFAFKEGWRDGAFFGGHPVAKRLSTIDRHSFIVGAKGSGRTTLAYALHYYYTTQQRFFAVYLPGTLGLKIQDELLVQLFDFVLAEPIFLRQLTINQRRLLAQLLLSQWSAFYVQGRIEQEQAAIYSTFSPRSLREKDEAAAHLHLLNTTVKEESKHNFEASLEDISVVTRTLGFEKILLVFDLLGDPSEQVWLQNDILPHLKRWQKNRILLICFTPNTKLVESLTPLPDIYIGSLSWTEEELMAWVQWRYQVFAGPRQAIEQHFTENALSHMIKLSKCNPQKFIRLWQSTNNILNDQNQFISIDIINQAANQSFGSLHTTVDKTYFESQSADKETYELYDLIEGSLQSRDLYHLIKWVLSPKARQLLAQSTGYDQILEDKYLAKFINEIQEKETSHAFSEKVYQLVRTDTQLLDILNQRFDNNDLITICHKMGIDHENLSGRVKKERFISLIEYCERQYRILDLVDEIDKERPGIFNLSNYRDKVGA